MQRSVENWTAKVDTAVAGLRAVLSARERAAGQFGRSAVRRENMIEHATPRHHLGAHRLWLMGEVHERPSLVDGRPGEAANMAGAS
jgi:hypothetical protein